MTSSRTRRAVPSAAWVTGAVALLAGCTGGGNRADTAPTGTSRTLVSAEPVTAAAGPSADARIAAAREAVFRLGTVVPRGGPGADIGATTSGSAALVGRDADGLLDTRITGGSWTVRVTCTGRSRVTAYAAAPSVLARLDVGATATPDTRGTARTVVPSGTIVAFDAGRPGPDGLEVRLTSEDAVPLTGVAYELARAG